jgi:hypothetical protein
MKMLKFLSVIFMVSFLSNFAFSQNSNPLKVTMIQQATDISYRNINLFATVKPVENSPQFKVFVYYKVGNRDIDLVDFTDVRLSNEIFAKKAAEVIINRIKNDESLIIDNDDLSYILSN